MLHFRSSEMCSFEAGLTALLKPEAAHRFYPQVLETGSSRPSKWRLACQPVNRLGMVLALQAGSEEDVGQGAKQKGFQRAGSDGEPGSQESAFLEL